MEGILGFRPGFKVWIGKNGAVLGGGLYRLLEGIDREGSIAAAASGMGMSYRAAWGKIKAAEKKWGITLVSTRVGGEAGGGTQLTGEARLLLDKYLELHREAENLMIRFLKESNFF